MFSFFKKNQETNHGWFTVYGMEEVYQFLTEKRIQKKIDELKNSPTLGTRFEDFVSKKEHSSPSGELSFLLSVLWYFKNELDLAIYLHEKSKKFSEGNYPFNKFLKEVWENHLLSMDRLSIRNPEKKEYCNSWKRPIFWLEYDRLYVELILNLCFNFNLQKFSNLCFEGEFQRKGSLIKTPEVEITFRSKRKPKVGYYLTFKGDSLIKDFKIDLIENQKDEYFFNTKFGSYCLKLTSDKAVIKKVSEFSNDNILLIKSTDFVKIIEKLIDEYLSDFDKITKRYTNELTKTEINFFLYISLKIKGLNPILIEDVKNKINLNQGIWGELDRYFNVSIQGFDF